MRKDLTTVKPLFSSFLSCSTDTEQILKLLFIETKPYSDKLKRLLLVHNPDCLDEENEDYKELIDDYSLGKMIKDGYIRLNPKIERGEHEAIKAYMLLSFDNFAPSANPEFLDYTINFDIICYMDAWWLDDYKVRPLQICGYIDGILNSISNKNKQLYKSNQNIKLSGVGEYKLLGCNEAVLNQDISMYTLSYRGVHFSEDKEQLNK